MKEIREFVNFIENAMQTWESYAAWDKLPESARAKLQAAFPSPAELFSFMSDGKVKPEEMQLEVETGALVFTATPGREITQLRRKWFYDRNEIKLDNLFLHPNHQKQGIGSRVLQNTVAVAQKLGVDKLTMQTQDAGGHVWAKAGFLPASEGDESDLELQIISNINGDAFDQLPEDEREAAREEVMDVLAMGGIWDVAVHHYGEYAMNGTRWSGVLDLHNATQMSMLKNFVERNS